MERAVAIKVLQDHLGTGEGEKLFFREARTAGALNHPGIVTVHDLGRDHDGVLYLVMEQVPGRDLAVVLRSGPLPVADVLAWTAQAADALDAAHTARILHRDLKPANLMLTPAGNVKILDFGIARYASTRATASRIIGTTAYMPPERLLGKVGDARGDLYALGCVLYELLTGCTPFSFVDPAALMYAHVYTPPPPAASYRPDLPPSVDALLAELLAKDPDHRPGSAAAVRDRLRRVALQALGPPLTQSPDLSYRSTNLSTVTGNFRPPQGLRTAPTPSHRPWAYPTTDSVTSSPAVVGGTVYIGSNDGKVYALEIATGSVRWTYRTGGVVGSSPAVVDGTVYIGSNDGRVYALDATTGAPRWAYSTGGMVFGSPSVVGGTVFIGSKDHKVYALEATTGAPRWAYTTGDGVSSRPAVVEGTVYIGSNDGRVYALDATTGTPRWAYTTDDCVSSSPAVVDGTVYIGSADEKVYALDAGTGATRWTYTTGGYVLSSPAVVDGTVYIGSDDGKVYALDAVTGTRRWAFRTGSGVHSSPAVVDGTVYLGSSDWKVYALGAVGTRRWTFHAALRWTYPTGGMVQSSPAVVNGMVYIGSKDHKVYALDVTTGQVRAS
jgi:Serine/threonine protein kinase